MAVDVAGLPHPNVGESLPVVSNRSVQTGLHSFIIRRNHRHSGAAGNQSRHGALAPGAFSTSDGRGDLLVRPASARTSGAHQPRKHLRVDLDCQCAILQLCVFWEHWTEVGVIIGGGARSEKSDSFMINYFISVRLYFFVCVVLGRLPCFYGSLPPLGYPLPSKERKGVGDDSKSGREKKVFSSYQFM